jgi:hypothetical protein
MRSVGASQNVLFSCRVVKVSLVDFLFSFYFRIFYRQCFAPMACKKQTLPLVGWSKNISATTQLL